MSGLENPSDCKPSTLGQNHCCFKRKCVIHVKFFLYTVVTDFGNIRQGNSLFRQGRVHRLNRRCPSGDAAPGSHNPEGSEKCGSTQKCSTLTRWSMSLSWWKEVLAIEVVQKIVEVPQFQCIDKVVDVLVIMLRPIPAVQRVQQTVEALQIQFIDRVGAGLCGRPWRFHRCGSWSRLLTCPLFPVSMTHIQTCGDADFVCLSVARWFFKFWFT